MPDIEQNTSLIDLRPLEAPLTKLAETVKSVVDIWVEPKKKIEHAKADLAIERLMALGRLDNEDALAQRMAQRVVNQELKRQENIDAVTQAAVKYLPENVTEEKVNPDWTARLYQNCQDISDTEMQELWAKILAGEVARPNSFSLRTLDILKNITAEEAHIFSKIAQASIDSGGYSAFIMHFTDYNKYREFFDFDYQDLLLASELGLIELSDNLTLSISATDEADSHTFFNGKLSATISLNNKEAALHVDIFTKVGKELLSLIEISGNPTYFRHFPKIIIGRATVLFDNF